MPHRILAACLPSSQAQDRPDLRSRFPGVVSAQPGPILKMETFPPATTRFEQESQWEVERPRGGALTCACCGDGGGDGGTQQATSREAQPQAGTRAQTEVAPRTPVGTEPKASSSSQSPQMTEKDKAQSNVKPKQLLAPSNEAETGRVHSTPSASRVSSVPTQPRSRRTTLPSKFSTGQHSATSSNLPPLGEGATEHGGSTNPIIPLSSPAAWGNRQPPGGPPHKPPFMQ